jgi:hypothetical protein
MNKKKSKKSARKQLECMKAEFLQSVDKKVIKKCNRFGMGTYGK